MTRERLPLTLEAINRELHCRREAGRSTHFDASDFNFEVLRDDDAGVFFRLRIRFADGDVMQLDTREPAAIIRRIAQIDTH